MNNEQNPPRPNLSLNERPSVAFHLIKFGIWTLALAFAGLIVLFAGRELGLLSKPLPPNAPNNLVADETSKTGTAKEAITAPTNTAPTKEATDAGELLSKLTLAKNEQRLIVTQTKDVLLALDEWFKESKQFKSQSDSLQTSEQGKNIAANPTLLSRMRAILEQPRPRTSDAEDLRLSAELAKASAEKSLQAPSDASLPPDALKAQIQSMLTQAVQGRDAFKKVNEQIDVIEGIASREKTPGKETLRDALARIRREEVEKEAADIAAAQQRAREAATKQLVQQRELEEREKGRLELAANEQRIKLEMAAREERTKEERLWKIARSRRAKELLYPATALSPDSKSAITYQVRRLGSPFRDRLTLHTYMVNDLGNDGWRELNQRDATCQQEFGMTLHELFQQVCLRDQENSFLSDTEIKGLLANAKEQHVKERLTLGADKRVSPKPLPKPDWVRD